MYLKYVQILRGGIFSDPPLAKKLKRIKFSNTIKTLHLFIIQVKLTFINVCMKN